MICFQKVGCRNTTCVCVQKKVGCRSPTCVCVCPEAPDLKQEERLQELESCSGVGSTSDDTEVREVSSRPSTPGLSVVSG